MKEVVAIVPFAMFNSPEEERKGSENGSGPVRKRNRPMLSCVLCHERRVKCDRGRPCQSCTSYGTPDQCSYAARPNKRAKSGMDGTFKRPQQLFAHSNTSLESYNEASLLPAERKSSGASLLSLTSFVERVSMTASA